MKIEFLAEASGACPLIRLFEYRPGEINQLRHVCRELADRRIIELVLHDQPWIEAIAGCRFIWRTAPTNVGVMMRSGTEPFVLALSDEGWRWTEQLLEPFAEGRSGFNWLTCEGNVKVLLSRDGRW